MIIDRDRLKGVGAAHMADALTKLALPKRFARPETKPAFAIAGLVVGRALPAKHFGSVDVFLAAFERAAPGDVLVVDNEGRLDEGCLGDLITAEAKLAGLAGIVIHGAHRDTAQLREIGLPVWSLGCIPYGPTVLRAPTGVPVMLGDAIVTQDDVVIADEDGVIFMEAVHADKVIAAALEIARREEKQRAAMVSGRTLRDQLKFHEFQAAREKNPALTFREHINRVRGAVET
jgi:regulator of RNase E activity RraA